MSPMLLAVCGLLSTLLNWILLLLVAPTRGQCSFVLIIFTSSIASIDKQPLKFGNHLCRLAIESLTYWLTNGGYKNTNCSGYATNDYIVYTEFRYNPYVCVFMNVLFFVMYKLLPGSLIDYACVV